MQKRKELAMIAGNFELEKFGLKNLSILVNFVSSVPL